MNYDTMTAHEILVMAVTTAYKEDYLPVIESALRKAVIREASVGTVYVARDETDGCPEFRFRCAESLTSVSTGNVCQLCRELIPERQYALIPSNLVAKEPLITPEELAYMKREIELHEDYELNVGKKP